MVWKAEIITANKSALLSPGIRKCEIVIEANQIRTLSCQLDPTSLIDVDDEIAIKRDKKYLFRGFVNELRSDSYNTLKVSAVGMEDMLMHRITEGYSESRWSNWNVSVYREGTPNTSDQPSNDGRYNYVSWPIGNVCEDLIALANKSEDTTVRIDPNASVVTCTVYGFEVAYDYVGTAVFSLFNSLGLSRTVNDSSGYTYLNFSTSFGRGSVADPVKWYKLARNLASTTKLRTLAGTGNRVTVLGSGGGAAQLAYSAENTSSWGRRRREKVVVDGAITNTSLLSDKAATILDECDQPIDTFDVNIPYDPTIGLYDYVGIYDQITNISSVAQIASITYTLDDRSGERMQITTAKVGYDLANKLSAINQAITGMGTHTAYASIDVTHDPIYNVSHWLENLSSRIAVLEGSTPSPGENYVLDNADSYVIDDAGSFVTVET